jgi:hypothetical protein
MGADVLAGIFAGVVFGLMVGWQIRAIICERKHL